MMGWTKGPDGIRLHCTLEPIRPRGQAVVQAWDMSASVTVDLTDRQKRMLLDAMSKLEPSRPFAVNSMAYHVTWDE